MSDLNLVLTDYLFDLVYLKWLEQNAYSYVFLNSSKGSTIAGIVSGCVLGLALIAAVIIAVFCCLKRRRGVQGQVMGPVVSIPMATATAGTALASPGGGLNFNGPGGSISQFTGPGGSVTQFTGPGGSVTQFTGPGGRMAMTTTTAG